MATNIFNFDGTLLTTVADGALDTTHASIKFPGKGYQNYGEPVLESLLWVMQNFSGTTAPAFPQRGQLWYDTTVGSEILKVYNGTQWAIAGGVISSDTDPGAGANQGAFWYDSVNKQIKTWNGSAWDIVGPLGSKINTDPVDPVKPVNSAIEAMRVNAVEDGLSKQIWRISIGGSIFAILSKEPAFTPQSSIITSGGFAKIYPGINFSTNISDASVSGDSTIFKSTQNNLPNLDTTYDLGSATKKFRTVFGSTGRFFNGLGVGTNYSTQHKFQVTGPSRFDGTVNIGPGTTSTVPLKFNAAPTVPPGTEQLGAVEFDGNNFYFTSLLGGVPTRRTPLFGVDIAAGKVLYVSPVGNDANDGRSRNTPFRTIKQALSYLTEVSPYREGYTIFVETGDYLEQNPLFVPAKTSIVGDNLRRVTVRPVHTQLDLFHVEQATYFFGITIKDHRAPSFAFSFPCSTATATVQNGQISQINYMYSQTGYDRFNPPVIFIESPPLSSGGTTATATPDIVDNAIIDVVVTNPGSGYSLVPGATNVIIDPATTGGGQNAAFRVRTNELGQVTGVDITDPGFDYGNDVVINIAGSGTGATARVVKGNGVIRRYTITNPGAGYDPNRPPHISIKSVNPPFISSSPYVQNCSSITGPFDIDGRLITKLPGPGNWTSATNPGSPFNVLDPVGAGGGIRVDGEVVSATTVVRSFVVDSFTQINQGGIGHLIINKGYTQFVSCFTTFSSVGFWVRSGGFANISNSVVDFGDSGIRAEGYYPVAYTTGLMASTFYSTVAGVTITEGGAGYNTATVAVTFTGGLDPLYPSARAATGVAYIENGEVVGVTITDPGEGYTGSIVDPVEVIFAAPPAGPGATTASGTVTLQPPENFVVTNVNRKPQYGSGILYNGRFYIIRQVDAVQNNPTSWRIQTVPPILSATLGTNVAFHDVSNISTGSLSLEYVGAGVTYNALPVYGGNPVEENQVQDGETNPDFYPGRVYYVTIDNTGNFKVGDYFSVNFIDGTVRLNANAFDLTNIVSIGPFRRNGISVGTYANEISYDPTLTHVINPTTLDRHTIPTQSAVRQYFTQFTTNVYPETSNVYSVGSANKKLANVVATNGYFSTVGIGTTQAASILDVVGNTVFGAPDGLSAVRLRAAADEHPEFSIHSYGDSTDGLFGGFSSYASRGTVSSKLETQNGDIVTWIKGAGYNTTTSSYNSLAEIHIIQSDDAISTGNPGSIVFATSDGATFDERMRITHTGNVGVATSVAASVFHVNGDLTVTNGELRGFLSPSSDAQFRAINGNYGVMFLNDGSSFKLLQTASTATPESDTYNAYRPLELNLVNGAVSIDGTGRGTTFGGSITATTGTVSVTTLSSTTVNNSGAINAASVKATGQIMAQSMVSNTSITSGTGLTVTTGGANITGNTLITGQLDVTGDIVAFSTSDSRLKTNVAVIEQALDKVNKLNGVTFNWIDTNKDLTKREAGVIAQDVMQVLPETVVTRDNGYLAVDYPKLVPLLVEAIKELTSRIEKLEAEKQ